MISCGTEARGRVRSAELLLIYPDTGTQILCPPHAYLCLGSVLEKAGFRVTVLDQRVEASFATCLKAYLEDTTPLFVGVSSMTGSQIASGLSICRHIKREHPNIPLVWGGVHPTLLPRQTVQDRSVDIVVKNEGEQTCLELATACRDGQPLDSVRGIVYEKDGRVRETEDRAFIDLNAYPPPDWSLVDVEEYIVADNQHQRRLDLYTSRGCPFNCGFCYNPAFNRRQWRARSSDSVLEEISWLVSNHRVQHIWFADDNFMVSRSRVLEICNGIAQNQMSLTLTGSARPEYICGDHELMNSLVQAGFKQIYMGAESGSERILDLINRGNTRLHCLQAAQICQEYGVTPIFSFMVGFPGESKDEVLATLDFAKQLKSVNKNAVITDFKVYTPYPGTSLYDLALQQGLTQPKSLKGWSKYVWGSVKLPWVRDMRFLRTVSLVSLFANYFQELQQNRATTTPIFEAACSFLRWLARIRWRNSFFGLPFEWTLVGKLISRGYHSRAIRCDRKGS